MSRFLAFLAALSVASLTSAAEPLTTVSDVAITSDGRLLVNGNPFLMIGTSPGPPTNIRTPEGRNGWAELAADGINVVRGIVALDEASTRTRSTFDAYLEHAAQNGIYVWPQLHHLPVINEKNNRARLEEVIHRYREHPAVLMWKSVDEPEWGKKPASQLVEAYRLIKEWDPKHPVWICQAPRGTAATLAPYSDACDVLSFDIYPVSNRPGKHAPQANHGLSVVGDFTTQAVALIRPGQMPFMVLQGAWSGVLPTHNPKNELMFPSFRQQRYMVYQSFICGGNGFSFFGLTLGLVGRDYDLGFNWTFWRAVLRPLLAEFKPGSELWPVMTSPDTTYPLTFTGAPQIEARWKVVGPYVYIFAAAREGAPQQVTFSGLRDGEVVVLHENRFLNAAGGSFTDTFAEHDVHIYRATRHIPNAEVRKNKEALAKEAAEGARKKAAPQSEIFIPEGAKE